MEYPVWEVGIGLAVVAVVLLVLFLRRKKRPGSEAHAMYIAGLNNLVDGEFQKALEKLRQTVRFDTDNIDAYIRIGDILRDKGQADRAIKIHLDLLVRPDLIDDQILSIQKSLAKDYRAYKQYKQALQACDRVLEIERQNQWCRDFQLEIFEEMQNWRGAAEALKKNTRFSRLEKNSLLACYKVEEGIQLTKKNHEHEGRICFREAIKLDDGCISAYLELADSYVREDRLDSAVTSLKRLLQKNSGYSAAVFNRLKDLLFDLGNFGEIENIYRQILEVNPDVADAHLGLAELYEKKGELRQAVQACDHALKIEPHRLETKALLVKLNAKLGRPELAAEIASDLAAEIVKNIGRYTCVRCGFSKNDYFSHCPRCSAWNSAQKDSGREGA